MIAVRTVPARDIPELSAWAQPFIRSGASYVAAAVAAAHKRARGIDADQ
jgi:hypothetical protein